MKLRIAWKVFRSEPGSYRKSTEHMARKRVRRYLSRSRFVWAPVLDDATIADHIKHKLLTDPGKLDIEPSYGFPLSMVHQSPTPALLAWVKTSVEKAMGCEVADVRADGNRVIVVTGAKAPSEISVTTVVGGNDGR